jgi:peptidoglycan-N-acetylglucosamine deacetylase
MKKLLLVFTFILVASALSGCAVLDKEKDKEKNLLPEKSLGQIQEHTKDYVIYANYPELGIDDIDSQIKDFAESEVNNFKQKLPENIQHESQGYEGFEDVKYEMHFSYENIINNDNIAILEFKEYNKINDDNGHHLVKTKIYNKKTNKEIGLADFFTSDDYANKLSETIKNKLKDQLKDDYNEDLVSKSLGLGADNLSVFELLPNKKIEFIFEPGQVADESKGVIRVEIELNDLDSILNYENIKLVYTDINKESFKKDDKNIEIKDKADVKKDDQVKKENSIDGGKNIALTFDDGPAASTSKLLDLLKKEDIKATFFVLGKNVSVHQDTIARMVKEGHQVGMHSWDHPQLTKLSVAQVQDQFNRTHDIIKQASNGYNSQLVRPPYGAINQTVKGAIPYPLILWSVDPDDWKDRNSDTVYQRVTSETKPGSIVLSHDIYETTIDAYPRIIEYFKNNGFTFMTVGELLGFEKNGYPKGGVFSHQ